MKPISTTVHGAIDYTFVVAVLVIPRLLGRTRPARRLATIVSIGVVIYSLLTQYRLGVFRVLPMRGHIALDLVHCAALLTTPIVAPDEDARVRAGLAGLAVGGVAVALLTNNDDATPAER